MPEFYGMNAYMLLCAAGVAVMLVLPNKAPAFFGFASAAAPLHFAGAVLPGNIANTYLKQQDQGNFDPDVYEFTAPAGSGRSQVRPVCASSCRATAALSTQGRSRQQSADT